jgi:hypothetical protein
VIDPAQRVARSRLRRFDELYDRQSRLASDQAQGDFGARGQVKRGKLLDLSGVDDAVQTCSDEWGGGAQRGMQGDPLRGSAMQHKRVRYRRRSAMR